MTNVKASIQKGKNIPAEGTRAPKPEAAFTSNSRMQSYPLVQSYPSMWAAISLVAQPVSFEDLKRFYRLDSTAS